jgi:hypothetical protein
MTATTCGISNCQTHALGQPAVISVDLPDGSAVTWIRDRRTGIYRAESNTELDWPADRDSMPAFRRLYQWDRAGAGDVSRLIDRIREYDPRECAAQGHSLADHDWS